MHITGIRFHCKVEIPHPTPGNTHQLPLIRAVPTRYPQKPVHLFVVKEGK